MSHFPYFSQLVDAAFLVFDSSTKAFISLVPLVFLVRIFLIKAMFRSSIHYGQLLRDLMLMYVGFFFFEEIVRFVLKVPEYAENLVGASESVEMKEFKSSGSFLGLLGYSIDEALKYVAVFFYWLMAFLYFIFISLMICFGGFVVFFSTMFQMRWMASAFFVIMVMLSMWPFLWYVVDHSVAEILKQMMKSSSEFAIFSTNLGGNLVKVGAPLLGLLYALKDPVRVTGGVKESLSHTLNPTKKMGGFAKNRAKDLASVTGTDKVYRGHITPRIEKMKSKAGSARDRGLNATKQMAPLASYGLAKGLNKISRNKAKNETSEKLKNFSSYKSELDSRITEQEKQKVINRRRKRQRTKVIRSTKSTANENIQSNDKLIQSSKSMDSFQNKSSTHKVHNKSKSSSFKTEQKTSLNKSKNITSSQASGHKEASAKHNISKRRGKVDADT